MKHLKILKSTGWIVLILFNMLSSCKQDDEDGLTPGKIFLSVDGRTTVLSGGNATHIQVYGQQILTLAAYKNIQFPQEEQLAITFQNVIPEQNHTYSFGYFSQNNQEYIQGGYIKTVENIPLSYLTTGYDNYTGTVTITSLTDRNIKGNFTFRAVNTVNLSLTVDVSGEFNLNIVNR